MSAAAEQAVTPAIVDTIRAGLPEIPRRRRVSFMVAQAVLRHLARWADDTVDGGWVCDDSVQQITNGTGVPVGTVRKALDNLNRLGLVVTLHRGGGYGEDRRGSTRALILDPSGPATARAMRAQLTPRAGRAELMPQLRALTTATARANDRNSARLARASSSSSIHSSIGATARAADDDDGLDLETARSIAAAAYADEVAGQGRAADPGAVNRWLGAVGSGA